MYGAHRFGVLATHPSAFKDSEDIKLRPSNNSEPYSVTSKGIRIQLPLYGNQYAILDCYDANDPSSAFALDLMEISDKTDVLARGTAYPWITLDEKEIARAERRTIYLLKAGEATEYETKGRDRCWIRSLELAGCSYKLSDGFPLSNLGYQYQKRIMSISKTWMMTEKMQFAFTSANGKGFLIVLHPNSKNGNGALSVVDLGLQSVSNTSDLESLVRNTRSIREPGSSDCISRNGEKISAKIDILDVCGERMYVVDIQVEKFQ